MSEQRSVATQLAERGYSEPVVRRNGFRVSPLRRPPMNRASKPGKAEVAGLPWPANHMTETAFQSMVEADAAKLGWWASHAHLPYFDTAGWPDLALVHPERHVFMVRELKVTDERGRVNKPTPVQSRWIAALANADVNVGVWTWPHDRERYLIELGAVL